MQNIRARDIGIMLVFIFGCELIGGLGGIVSASAIGTWYQSLHKPSYTPPDWIFGPAWTTLYAVMGIAAYLVWREGFGKRIVKAALFAFAIQLFFNALWSPLFFGLHSPLLAMVDIIFLWVALVITTAYFFHVITTAGLLMLPYLAWVSFATVLNYGLWRLN